MAASSPRRKKRRGKGRSRNKVTNYKLQITSTLLPVNVQDDSIMKGRPTPNANPGQAQSRLWLHRHLEGKKRRGNERSRNKVRRSKNSLVDYQGVVASEPLPEPALILMRDPPPPHLSVPVRLSSHAPITNYVYIITTLRSG